MMNWSTVIDLANYIHTVDAAQLERCVEPRSRCVVGRAYYGSFCVVREFIRAVTHLPLDDARAHGDVRDEITALANDVRVHGRRVVIGGVSVYASRVCAKIGKNLYELHEKRKAADYEDPSMNEWDAQAALDL